MASATLELLEFIRSNNLKPLVPLGEGEDAGGLESRCGFC